MIKNLPKSKEIDYQIIKRNEYDKLINLIYRLGSICTLDQFLKIYERYSNINSPTYAKQKGRNILSEMEKLNLIKFDNLNKYKIFYLRRFALSFISNDYNKFKKTGYSSLVKDKNLRISFLKAEYYLKYKTIISNENMNNQLLRITKEIYDATVKNPKLIYDSKLLKQILVDKGISKCHNEVQNLHDNNIIKLLWIQIKSIYDGLKLQNQTISNDPFYKKLFINDKFINIHYVPEIIIFDVHDINFYSKKIDELFYKIHNIPSNNTRDMQNYFKAKKTLGWEGYNHIGYVFKIVGYDYNDLLRKKDFIDSHIKENPNAVLLTNAKIEYLDIEKYFSNTYKKSDYLKAIDDKFEDLLARKATFL